MYFRNNHPAYFETQNAISHWPETATAIAVRLNSQNTIKILTPYGLDLFNLITRHTPGFDLALFQKRANAKQWKKYWENLIFIANSE
jgi:uncharacterized protein